MSQTGASYDVYPVLNAANRSRLREIAAALRASEHFIGAQWQDDADWLDALSKDPHWRPFHVYVHTGEGWRGPIDEVFSNSAEGVLSCINSDWPIDVGDRFLVVPLEPGSIYDKPRDVTVTEKREFRIYDTREEQ